MSPTPSSFLVVLYNIYILEHIVNYDHALIIRKGQLRGILHDILDINHRKMKHFTATKE